MRLVIAALALAGCVNQDGQTICEANYDGPRAARVSELCTVSVAPGAPIPTSGVYCGGMVPGATAANECRFDESGSNGSGVSLGICAQACTGSGRCGLAWSSGSSSGTSVCMSTGFCLPECPVDASRACPAGLDCVSRRAADGQQHRVCVPHSC